MTEARSLNHLVESIDLRAVPPLSFSTSASIIVATSVCQISSQTVRTSRPAGSKCKARGATSPV